MALEIVAELVIVENGNILRNEPQGVTMIRTNEEGVGVFKDLKIGDSTTASYESLFKLRFRVPRLFTYPPHLL